MGVLLDSRLTPRLADGPVESARSNPALSRSSSPPGLVEAAGRRRGRYLTQIAHPVVCARSRSDARGPRHKLEAPFAVERLSGGFVLLDVEADDGEASLGCELDEGCHQFRPAPRTTLVGRDDEFRQVAAPATLIRKLAEAHEACFVQAEGGLRREAAVSGQCGAIEWKPERWSGPELAVPT